MQWECSDVGAATSIPASSESDAVPPPPPEAPVASTTDNTAGVQAQAQPAPSGGSNSSTTSPPLLVPDNTPVPAAPIYNALVALWKSSPACANAPNASNSVQVRGGTLAARRMLHAAWLCAHTQVVAAG